MSLLVAIICYRGLKKFSIALFIALIFLGCLADTLGENYSGWGLNRLTNHNEDYLIYNPYLILSTPILLHLFGKMLRLTKKEKKVFLWISLLVMALILLNYFFGEGVFNFNTNSLVLIALVTIFLSVFVLLRLAMEEERVITFFKEPFFWISSGFLLFGLGELILGLQTYIEMNNIKLFGKSIYTLVMDILNVFLYSAFSLAFILCQKYIRT